MKISSISLFLVTYFLIGVVLGNDSQALNTVLLINNSKDTISLSARYDAIHEECKKTGKIKWGQKVHSYMAQTKNIAPNKSIEVDLSGKENNILFGCPPPSITVTVTNNSACASDCSCRARMAWKYKGTKQCKAGPYKVEAEFVGGFYNLSKVTISK